ncbi:Vacuolar ATP synthase subunit h [Oopsacas minuta]|uniref:V-type proton ATPase subunit H n=1 Tax=Oopsacas minuta TaxID=111878 RepID=A0AAV7JPN7_9METZ|nr:Vacuolar ATP synthase subunit h [Oopsacas minuta]
MSGSKYEKLPASGNYGNNFGPDTMSGLSPPAIEDSLLKEAEAILHGDRKIHWNSLPNSIISKAEASQLSELVNADHPHTQDTMIRQNGVKHVEIFLKMLKMRDDRHLKHFLALIHDFIEGDKDRIRYFLEYMNQEDSVDPTLPLVNLLNVKHPFVQYMAALLIGRFTMLAHYQMPDENKDIFLQWVTQQFRMQSSEYLTSCAVALQYLLRTDTYRVYYIKKFSIKPMIDLLISKKGLQLQYNLLFSLWLLSFNPNVCIKLTDKEHHVIPVLADILKHSTKQKIIRLIVATFRNLLSKPESISEQQKNAVTLIQKKVHLQLSVLKDQDLEDDELTDDTMFVFTQLETTLQDISTFDEYVSEVRSGTLEWSPVHRSEKFWRECAPRLNENRFEIVYLLINYLQESRNDQVLSIAAHDLGQYVRYYPRGKTILEREGAKELIMRLLHSEDSSLRMEALLAIQKMMVHNWEYLGKQTAEAVTK